MHFKDNNGAIRRTGTALLFICLLALLPFLGLADFNTKGEPREAVVALSIIDQNNWILPTNNGGEIPYKPPFLHWCVAAASLLNGGVVNEYTSRLPSALALAGMTLATFIFFARRRDTAVGLLTATVLFTAFEIYRAGMNCRVDMMLTALSVGAIYMLYRWWERGMRGFPAIAILLMSAATLTKGPVGIIIPCLAAGCFMLLRGEPFFKAFIWLSLWGVLSLVLPLCWYAAAYAQGGHEFLDLVLEENFGRMTGTMAYESHLNPWYYNIVTLAAGFLPWTLAAAAALFLARWAGLRDAGHGAWERLRCWLRTVRPCTLLALTAAVVIFIFYCLPASKRSVYLMPMYPFTAYFLAEMMMWMSRRRPGSLRWLGDLLAALGVVLFAAFVLIKCGVIPDSLFGHGKHAGQNIAMLHSLRDADGFRPWFWAAMSPLAALAWWMRTRRHGLALPWLGSGHDGTAARLPLAIGATAVALYMSLSGCYQPAVLNAKSQKGYAARIAAQYPDSPGRIYEYIAAAEEAAGNPVHFFELNFYMGDVVRNFVRENPGEGYLLIEPGDAEAALPRFEAAGYTFQRLIEPTPASPRHTPELYRFTRK